MTMFPESIIFWMFLLVVVAAGVVNLYRGIRRMFRLPDRNEERAFATTWNIKAWAQKYGLRFFNIANQLRQAARMEVNTGKDFFRADQVMHMGHDGPYVEGKVKGRNVWLYMIAGRARYRSLHGIDVEGVSVSHQTSTLLKSLEPLGEDFFERTTPAQQQTIMYAWCLEISTHPIPHRLRITRQSMQEDDELNTEGRDFEKRYDVNNFEDSLALQLLDPHMMQLILDSHVDAIEFSDSSLVIYELNKHTTAEVLDALLNAGLQIAQQVDQNYPLGKYKKDNGN